MKQIGRRQCLNDKRFYWGDYFKARNNKFSFQPMIRGNSFSN